jgi:hypothetical protein
VYPLFLCATVTGAPRGTKVKGFLNTRRYFYRHKQHGDFTLFPGISGVHRGPYTRYSIFARGRPSPRSVTRVTFAEPRDFALPVTNPGVMDISKRLKTDLDARRPVNVVLFIANIFHAANYNDDNIRRAPRVTIYVLIYMNHRANYKVTRRSYAATRIATHPARDYQPRCITLITS